MSAATDLLKKLCSMESRLRVAKIRPGVEFEYWSTPVTLAERSRAQKIAKGDTTEMALQLLISKAQDKNGQPMFHAGDIGELRHLIPASVADEILVQLVNDDEEELSQATPKPSSAPSVKTAS